MQTPNFEAVSGLDVYEGSEDEPISSWVDWLILIVECVCDFWQWVYNLGRQLMIVAGRCFR